MRKLAVLLALVFMASCAQVPKEASYPITYQEKMQASEHWQLLAKDTTNRAKSLFGQKGAIYVYDQDSSPFGEALRTFLTVELQNQGMAPSYDPNSPYALVWKVQNVTHQADRRNTPGLPFALVEALQTVMVGGTETDFKKPHTEVIISYELLKNGLSVMSGAQIYYINDADRNHYISQGEVPETSLRPIIYNVTNR